MLLVPRSQSSAINPLKTGDAIFGLVCKDTASVISTFDFTLTYRPTNGRFF